MFSIWKNRSNREKQLLSATGLMVCTWLIFQFVYTPVREQYESQLAAFEEASNTMVWLRQQASIINQAQRNLRIPGKDILDLIVNSIDRFKITNAKAKETTDEEGNIYIQADISSTDGKNMMKWLNYLTEEGLILLELNIKTLEQGKTDTTLTFSAR